METKNQSTPYSIMFSAKYYIFRLLFKLMEMCKEEFLERLKALDKILFNAMIWLVKAMCLTISASAIIILVYRCLQKLLTHDLD